MLQLGANIHKIFFSSKSFCLKFSQILKIFLPEIPQILKIFLPEIPQILKIFLKRTFSLYLNYMQNRVSNML